MWPLRAPGDGNSHGMDWGRAGQRILEKCGQVSGYGLFEGARPASTTEGLFTNGRGDLMESPRNHQIRRWPRCRPGSTMAAWAALS